jgi:hypothetical protein
MVCFEKNHFKLENINFKIDFQHKINTNFVTSNKTTVVALHRRSHTSTFKNKIWNIASHFNFWTSQYTWLVDVVQQYRACSKQFAKTFIQFGIKIKKELYFVYGFNSRKKETRNNSSMILFKCRITKFCFYYQTKPCKNFPTQKAEKNKITLKVWDSSMQFTLV